MLGGEVLPPNLDVLSSSKYVARHSITPDPKLLNPESNGSSVPKSLVVSAVGQGTLSKSNKQLEAINFNSQQLAALVHKQREDIDAILKWVDEFRDSIIKVQERITTTQSDEATQAQQQESYPRAEGAESLHSRMLSLESKVSNIEAKTDDINDLKLELSSLRRRTDLLEIHKSSPSPYVGFENRAVGGPFKFQARELMPKSIPSPTTIRNRLPSAKYFKRIKRESLLTPYATPESEAQEDIVISGTGKPAAWLSSTMYRKDSTATKEFGLFPDAVQERNAPVSRQSYDQQVAQDVVQSIRSSNETISEASAGRDDLETQDYLRAYVVTDDPDDADYYPLHGRGRSFEIAEASNRVILDLSIDCDEAEPQRSLPRRTPKADPDDDDGRPIGPRQRSDQLNGSYGRGHGKIRSRGGRSRISGGLSRGRYEDAQQTMSSRGTTAPYATPRRARGRNTIRRGMSSLGFGSARKRRRTSTIPNSNTEVSESDGRFTTGQHNEPSDQSAKPDGIGKSKVGSQTTAVVQTPGGRETSVLEKRRDEEGYLLRADGGRDQRSAKRKEKRRPETLVESAIDAMVVEDRHETLMRRIMGKRWNSSNAGGLKFQKDLK